MSWRYQVPGQGIVRGLGTFYIHYVGVKSQNDNIIREMIDKL